MREPKPVRVRIIRHQLRDGTRVPKGTPGSSPVSELSETYYAVFGRVRISLKTKDHGQAWVELRKLLRRRADVAAGIRDDVTDAAERPFGDLVKDWAQTLRDAGCTEKHVEQLAHDVLWLATSASWNRITDITADSCLAALAALTRGAEEARGRSPQTRNHYLQHVKQFCNWLCRPPRKLRDNPLVGLKPVSTETDRRHDRRSPSDEEIRVLLETTEASKVSRWGMTGRHRSLCYRVSMATGFRSKEMRSLNHQSFDLQAGTVTVHASYSKRKRLDTQHLPAWLVGQLRDWFAAGGGCWERLPFPAVEMLKRDLQAAGILYQTPGPDGAPLFFDFHALRHWYCTWAANEPGISPKTLQTLCRHSTPALTLKLYAKPRIGDVKAASESIPDPTSKRPTKRGKRAR